MYLISKLSYQRHFFESTLQLWQSKKNSQIAILLCSPTPLITRNTHDVSTPACN